MVAWLVACVAHEDTGSPVDGAPSVQVRGVEDSSAEADPVDVIRLPDEEVDVPIVIGAGPSGLAAAMDLGGALVLEADDEVGGRARWAGGFLFLVGTPEQAAAGVEDDVQTALDEWEALTGAAPTDATRAFLSANANVRARLVDLGLSLSLGRGEPVSGRIREHAPASGGSGLVAALSGGLPEGVEVRLSTPVRGLVLVDGRAAGVYTDDGWIGSDTVIVASGGFVDRADLVELHSGWDEGSWRLGDATLADGAALDWAAEVGLGTASLGALGSFRDVLGIAGPDGWAVAVEPFGALPWVWVDESGSRFVDESATWSVQLAGLTSIHSNVWAITTHESISPLVAPEALPYLVEGESFRCAETWSALAEDIAVDPAGLEETMANASAVASLEATDALRRPARTFLQLVGTPCAFRPGHLAAKNFGGLAVDGDGRVLDTVGAVVPGLWAVGEAAGMGVPGLGGAWGFDGSLSAVLWSGWRTAAAIKAE